MATTKKMDLLTAVEQIVDKAKGSGLSKEFYRKADRYIKYVSDKLDITKEQSVMMALFIDKSDSTSIKLGDFSKYLDCRTTRIIKYMIDIDELERREFVRCCREDHSLSYRVPVEVVEAFKKNEKYIPKDCSGLSCMELFSELETIFELRNDNELTYETTKEKIKHLFRCNPQLLYVQMVTNLDWREEWKMMLILFSHLFVNNNDDNIRFHDLDFLFDNRREWNSVKSQLNQGDYILQEEKMIEFNNDDGFVDRNSFRMTDEAKRELFSEINLSSKNRRGDMVRCENITPKKLFYGEKINAQIAELGQLL